jgi:hypothetical protein
VRNRWKELRDADIISVAAMERIILKLINSIGLSAYKEEARLWEQSSYRDPVYWKMSAGSIKLLYDEDGLPYHGYDESINTENSSYSEWVSNKQYISGDAVNYNGHSYVCSAKHTSSDILTPDKHYTCGSPSSGGVYDSPRHILEWYSKRLALLDQQFGYTSNNN